MSVVGSVMSVSVQRLNIVTELNMYKWNQIVNPNSNKSKFLCFVNDPSTIMYIYLIRRMEAGS